MPIKRRKSTPAAPRFREALTFLEDALLRETDECILWPFYKDRKGYGIVRVNKISKLAHREVLLRTSPTIDGKPLALHKPVVCHNPACINKRHLVWGSYEDNEAHKILDGTRIRGSGHQGAKLTEYDVEAIYTSEKTGSSLAAYYGVSTGLICCIRKGRKWRHLTAVLDQRVD